MFSCLYIALPTSRGQTKKKLSQADRASASTVNFGDGVSFLLVGER